MRHALTATVAALVTAWVVHDLALPAPTVFATWAVLTGLGVCIVRFADGEGLL
jgi:hypothetical protein